MVLSLFHQLQRTFSWRALVSSCNFRSLYMYILGTDHCHRDNVPWHYYLTRNVYIGYFCRSLYHFAFSRCYFSQWLCILIAWMALVMLFEWIDLALCLAFCVYLTLYVLLLLLILMLTTWMTNLLMLYWLQSRR